MDMLCYMHAGRPYGYLRTAGGKAISAPTLARMVGLTPGKVQLLLDELLDAGVPGVAADGAFFSRRMIRDERLRNARAAGGAQSVGHPNVPKPKDRQQTGITQEGSPAGYPSTSSLRPSPSSSSASTPTSASVHSRVGSEPASDSGGSPQAVEVTLFIEWFRKRYPQCRNGAEYHVQPGDPAIVQSLLKTYSFVRLQRMTDLLLTDEKDTFIQDSDRGLRPLRVKASWLDNSLAQHGVQIAQTVTSWDLVLEQIQLHVPRHDLHKWLVPLKFVEATSVAIVVEAPNPMTKGWVERHFAAVIQQAVVKVQPGAVLEIRTAIETSGPDGAG
jgi:hypothetical protein